MLEVIQEQDLLKVVEARGDMLAAPEHVDDAEGVWHLGRSSKFLAIV